MICDLHLPVTIKHVLSPKDVMSQDLSYCKPPLLSTELNEISTNAVRRGCLWTYYSSYNIRERSAPVTLSPPQESSYTVSRGCLWTYYSSYNIRERSAPVTLSHLKSHHTQLAGDVYEPTTVPITLGRGDIRILQQDLVYNSQCNVFSTKHDLHIEIHAS